MVVSEHFSHVTCYVADVESGLIRSKVGKISMLGKKIILPFYQK